MTYRPEYDGPCQRIKHDHAACSNVTGDPAACAPGCRPADCRVDVQHVGKDHLDPKSEHYDGPILPGYREGEAWRTILALLPDTTETRVAVHFLVEALRTAEDQATHARVDRDRGIREAMARSQDCEVHGQEIKALGVQVAGMDASYQRAERGRLALLGFLHAVEDLIMDVSINGLAGSGLTVASLLDALAKASRKTDATHKRAWS